jgi:hypothetical protein
MKRFMQKILSISQVNDVRRETAGSHRFPVNSGVHIQNRFLCPFPASFPPIPVLGNGDRIWLSFPERFRNADPIVFSGAEVRSVSCRLRNSDLMTKHDLGIPISCFDFGSSHVDPREYKLVS